MNVTVTWLDELQAAEQKINVLAWHLAQLSDRLSAVGLDKLAREADCYAELASSAEEHVKIGINSVLNENLQNARAMTSTVVDLALNLGKKS